MFDIKELQECVIFEAVRNSSDLEAAGEIVYDRDGSAENENNPDWVESIMYRLENRSDPKTMKQIRMGCQCGYGMGQKLALLKELKATLSNLEDLASSDRTKIADLPCKESSLCLQFFLCPYPMFADVDQSEIKTRYRCIAGYSKVLLEEAFGCEVDVGLLKSIKLGDSTCLMKIVPRGLIWG